MIIQAKKITKTYYEGIENRKLIVLKNLDFTLSEGTIVSITGLSGSGKSTLLHILGTLDHPDSGQVFFKGKDLSTFTEREQAYFRNKSIGFVFQFHHLLPELTTLENVAMPYLIKSTSYKESLSVAEELLDSLRLQDRKYHYPFQLSGGEQQRVAVARALINNPDLILADEPTGNLDPKHSQELIELLWSLNKQFDTTLLLVTHDLTLAKKADEAYNLIDGTLQPFLCTES